MIISLSPDRQEHSSSIPRLLPRQITKITAVLPAVITRVLSITLDAGEAVLELGGQYRVLSKVQHPRLSHLMVSNVLSYYMCCFHVGQT